MKSRNRFIFSSLLTSLATNVRRLLAVFGGLSRLKDAYYQILNDLVASKPRLLEGELSKLLLKKGFYYSGYHHQHHHNNNNHNNNNNNNDNNNNNNNNNNNHNNNNNKNNHNHNHNHRLRRYLRRRQSGATKLTDFRLLQLPE
jgi:hypothetical protein